MPVRPDRLSYRARDGVLETHISSNGGARAFSHFVEKAIQWSDKSNASRESKFRFNLLDTFFSDSIPDELLEELFKRPDSSNPGRILVVDPGSAYAQARASSIGGATCMQRSRSGLEILAKSMRRAIQGRGIQREQGVDLPDLDTYELAREVYELGRRLYINVRFYSVVPSGPLYFFRDILVCGRFSAGSSAIDLPWVMIVDDPSFDGDQYDMMLREYDYIWDTSYDFPSQLTTKISSDSNRGTPSLSASSDVRIFISHSTQDARIAGALVNCIEACLVVPEMSIRCTSSPGYRLSPGEITDEVLRSNLEDCAIVIGLLTQSSLSSTYVIMELGAAWGLKKTTCVLLDSQVPSSELLGPFARANVAYLDSEDHITSLIEKISETTDLPTIKNRAKFGWAIRKFVDLVKS